MTYALREACSRSADALAAPIAPVIALMTPAALGLSGDPVHEPVHGPRPEARPYGLLHDLTAHAIRLLLACRLQEVRPHAPYPLAAQTTRIIALTALTALGLFGTPVHEPVHAWRQAIPHDRNPA